MGHAPPRNTPSPTPEITPRARTLARLSNFKERYGSKSSFYHNLASHLFDNLQKQYRDAGRDGDVDSFDDDLSRIMEIVDFTAYALTPWEDREKDDYKPWYHLEVVVFGKHKTPLTIDKNNLETAVQLYLDGSFRSQRLDRLFVDMLVTEEYVAFINDPRANIDGFQMPIARGYLAGRFNAALVVAGVWAAAFILASLHWVGPELLLWALGLSVAFFAISTAFATWALVNYGPAYTKARNRITNVLDAMETVYSEIGSSTGSLSTAHIFQRIKDASDRGVVWNGQLHVLMEDIEARSKTF